MSKNLTSADWGCETTEYTIRLHNTRTNAVTTMTVKAHDRLDAVIFCEKTLGEHEWKAVRP